MKKIVAFVLMSMMLGYVGVECFALTAQEQLNLDNCWDITVNYKAGILGQPGSCENPNNTDTLSLDHWCAASETRDATTSKCIAKPVTQTPWVDQTVNGITIWEKCLTNGQCKFNIYDTLWIRKSVRAGTGDATSVGLFVQDIVLSATFFIWTVVTIALIVSGLMYIFAAASGNDPKKAKEGIIWALIWLVIIACSYFIIRLVQYLAKGV